MTYTVVIALVAVFIQGSVCAINRKIMRPEMH